MNCDHCGKELSLRSNYCSQCGEPIHPCMEDLNTYNIRIQANERCPDLNQKREYENYCPDCGENRLSYRLDSKNTLFHRLFTKVKDFYFEEIP